MTWIERLFPWLRPRPIPTPRPSPPVIADDLGAQVNLFRARNGLGALVVDPMITSIAFDWAGTMARGERMEHGDYWARLQAAFPRTLLGGGENVAYEYADAVACVAGWDDSFGHRVNMLGPWTHVGAGRAPGRDGRIYWCAVFAKLS